MEIVAIVGIYLTILLVAVEVLRRRIIADIYKIIVWYESYKTTQERRRFRK